MPTRLALCRAPAFPLAAGVLILLGCSVLDGMRGPVRQRSSALAMDGDLTVNDSGKVINQYAPLGADATQGSQTIQLGYGGYAGGFDTTAGNLLLIMQMQGASINQGTGASDAAYGTISDMGGAGLFEFVRIKSYDAGSHTVTIDGTCGGLKNNYTVAGKTQVVRVPQYGKVNVAQGASIQAQPWDGSVGGVVAFQARYATTVDGSIDVSGQGFRGGASAGYAGGYGGGFATDYTQYRDNGNAGLVTEKGEGIAGSQGDYDNLGGRYGRGAPANGGGGGNAYRGGGGGGGGAGDPTMWTGQGVMQGAFGTAWMLDPDYMGGLSNSMGGGRGGYTASQAAADPTAVAPGDPAWAGNQRRERGGLGGRPLLHDPYGRLFSGGGGGAGDSSQFQSAAGGNGGGIVYVLGSQIGGAGVIAANGGDGGDAKVPVLAARVRPLVAIGYGGLAVDGAGGGGAGGAVVLNAPRVDGVVAVAHGGAGGQANQADPNQAAGPGGGGGGGFVVLPAQSGATGSAMAGTGGTTLSGAMTNFPPNGATDGHDGVTAALPDATVLGASTPICNPADLSVTISPPSATVAEGATASYTVTVKNAGPNDALGARVHGLLTPAQSATWTCAASGDMPENTGCEQASGSGAIDVHVNLPVGGQAVFAVKVPIPRTARGAQGYQVTVIPPLTVVDPDLSNNNATANDNIPVPPDLAPPPAPDLAPPPATGLPPAVAGGGFGCQAGGGGDVPAGGALLLLAIALVLARRHAT